MKSVNIICYISLILLTLTCFIDFKNNIPKPKPAWPFHIALFLFLVANAVIYISLLPVLAGIELNMKNYLFFWGGGDNLELFRYRNISPVIIALLYFGFGKAKIEIASREYAFYGIMLNLFRSMFPRSLGVTKKLSEYIDRLGDETDKLKGTVSRLKDVADDHNWNMYEEEWEEIKNTTIIIENEISFLESIKMSITKEKLKDINITETQNMIVEQIEKSRLNVNEKLRYYIKKLIRKNILHEKSIEEIAELIDINNANDIIDKKCSSHIARAFGISFLCGILLSIILTLQNDHYTTHELIFYLVSSFFIFLYLFSFINKLDFSINGFSFALAVGAIGGFCGHNAFNIISKKSEIFTILSHSNDVNFLIYKIVKTLSVESSLGIIIGVFSASIVFLFKHFVNDNLKNSALKYILVSLSGGIMVLFVSKIAPDFKFGSDFYTGTICPLLTGSIVLMGISFVSGIFEKKI